MVELIQQSIFSIRLKSLTWALTTGFFFFLFGKLPVYRAKTCRLLVLWLIHYASFLVLLCPFHGPVENFCCICTQKSMLCFLTNINCFQPCFKSDWSRLVNRSVRDIGHFKVTGSRPAPGKSFWLIFRGLITLAQHRLGTGDCQISGLKLIPLPNLSLCD